MGNNNDENTVNTPVPMADDSGAAATAKTASSSTSSSTHSQEVLFSPELLKMYYSRLFPYHMLCSWLAYDPQTLTDGNSSNKNNANKHVFTNREFSMTKMVQGEEIYMRYQSFANEQDLKDGVMKNQPIKIDIGAVFSASPKNKNALPPNAFHTVQRELVFDIDLTDYDDTRRCGCTGAKICSKCWTFMNMALKVLKVGLEEDFGFTNIGWFYSGRRGIHAWVCDEEARMLSNEARSAVANYFEITLNKKRSEGLTYPLHPMLERAHQTLEPYFIEQVLPEDGHGVLASQEAWEELLDSLPEQAKESVGSNLKEKWAAKPYALSPAEKWAQLKRHLKVKFDLPAGIMGGDDGEIDDRDGGASSSSSKKRQKRTEIVSLNATRQRIAMWPVEVIFKYTYPRLDINVSKMQNHLLKSPFCVHPKTGRVCVPINPEYSDDFDPFAVPTLPRLMQELDDYHNKYEKDGNRGSQDSEAESSDSSKPRKAPQFDWEKTSLKPYFDHFQKDVLEPMQKELRRRARDQAEADAAIRGDF